jgi:hypothetical protein
MKLLVVQLKNLINLHSKFGNYTIIFKEKILLFF